MSRNADDELAPEQTEGFKVGEKKTIDEYQKLGRHSGVTAFLKTLPQQSKHDWLVHESI